MRSNRRCRRGVCPLLTLAAALASPSLVWGANSNATPLSAPAGVTPRFLGFNNGHFRSTSNTTAWVDYSGINAMRVWAAANDYENPDDRAPFGDGVASLADFDARKVALRADLMVNPDSTAYINWPAYNWSKTQTGRNNINLDYVLGQLHDKGVDVVLQTTRSNASMYALSASDYGGQWEQWQWYYTIAYWAARNYDVQRYQMYNEPDLDSDLPRSEWVLRMQLASDAIRSAIADVNAHFGKSLTADVYGPVAASTTGSLSTWGKDMLNANRTDYAGRPIGVDNVTTYDVHRYNSTGPTFASDQATFDNAIPGYNASGQNLPVTYTEFNRQNTSSFSSSPNSLDTPSVYTELASIFVGAMSQDVKGMYAFKFNQTYWTNSSGVEEPMKTGFYYVDDSASAHSTDTHNTTGATQGAEVMRLSDKALAGQRPRYAVSTGNALNDAVGSFDADTGRYYYYSVNRDASAASVSLNLSNWNVAPGQVVTVEEVSSAHHGDVSRSYVVPANKTLTFSQTAQSLFLLSIPSGTQQASMDLEATADASVSNASPGMNNGTSPTAFVNRSASSTADDATYLKFSLGGTGKATVSRALLRLTGQNVANSAQTTLHVYGLFDDSWTETGINWSNAPDLAGAADARLVNVGTDAFPVGQLTYDGTANEWAIDVTDFVRRHPDATLSFAVVREQRFTGDADTSRVQIYTREAATGRPRLSLSLYANPVYNWRANADGVLSVGSNLDVGTSPGAAGDVLNLGAFITSPHTVSVTTGTTLGTLNFNNLNGYTLAGAGVLTLDNGTAAPAINVYQGSHKVAATLAFASPTSLMIAAGAGLDITSNSLELSPAAISQATLRQYLLADQLFSSTADADPLLRLALGYVQINPAALLVRTTYFGDANLDGKVNADDFARIDRGFAKHLTNWSDGDFNYDGQVSAADYLLIDRVYFQQGAPLSAEFLADREARFGAGYVSELLASVPEPAWLVGMMGMLVAGTRPRRDGEKAR